MAAARNLCLASLLAAGLALPLCAQDISLDVVGAGDGLEERLRDAALLVQPLEEGEAARSAQDIVAAARADYSRLVAVLYEEGYFAPVVSIRIDGREAAQLSPLSGPRSVSEVRITVEPGARFTFSEAEIGPLARGTDLPEEFRPGGRASTPVLQDATEAAIQRWREAGRATAEAAGQEIRADARSATIAADIEIAPGPVITFGELRPEGAERMRPARTVEIAGLPTGLVYSPAELERAAERLRESGVFTSVSLLPVDPFDSTVMPVVARVVEAPLRRFGVGAELSTDSGGEVTAFWLHRNLFGGGERLRVEGRLSGIGQGEISPDAIDGIDGELRLRFSRPATITPDTTVYGELFAVGLDEPDYRQAEFGAEIGALHRASPQLEYGLGLGIQTTVIEDAFGERRANILTLPAEVTWDNRDVPLDPTTGIYAAGSATPFVTDGGGGGARVTLDARGYLSFGPEDRTVLAARIQTGSLFGGEVDDLPPDFLFWSGGSGTVRGQEYASLGAPQNGMDSGGRGFLGFSGEVRQQIGDTNFGVVGFADVGLVSSDALWQEDSEVHAGAGIGLRYDTAFGPIRVDLATPVGNGETGDALFLYIGIGQAF